MCRDIYKFTLLACAGAVMRMASAGTSQQEYTIKTTWDGDLYPDNVKLTFQKIPLVSNASRYGLRIEIDAPFYNDPIVPESQPVGSTDKLWNYEVVEVFFLSESEGWYLETEFAPRGHYLLLQLDTKQKVLKNQLPLEEYKGEVNVETGRWKGSAVIPWEYLPKNVNKFNAYAIHKSDSERVYMSLFPATKGQFSAPNFHRLELFQKISLDNF